MCMFMAWHANYAMVIASRIRVLLFLFSIKCVFSIIFLKVSFFFRRDGESCSREPASARGAGESES